MTSSAIPSLDLPSCPICSIVFDHDFARRNEPDCRLPISCLSCSHAICKSCLFDQKRKQDDTGDDDDKLKCGRCHEKALSAKEPLFYNRPLCNTLEQLKVLWHNLSESARERSAEKAVMVQQLQGHFSRVNWNAILSHGDGSSSSFPPNSTGTSTNPARHSRKAPPPYARQDDQRRYSTGAAPDAVRPRDSAVARPKEYSEHATRDSYAAREMAPPVARQDATRKRPSEYSTDHYAERPRARQDTARKRPSGYTRDHYAEQPGARRDAAVEATRTAEYNGNRFADRGEVPPVPRRDAAAEATRPAESSRDRYGAQKAAARKGLRDYGLSRDSRGSAPTKRLTATDDASELTAGSLPTFSTRGTRGHSVSFHEHSPSREVYYPSTSVRAETMPEPTVRGRPAIEHYAMQKAKEQASSQKKTADTPPDRRKESIPRRHGTARDQPVQQHTTLTLPRERPVSTTSRDGMYARLPSTTTPHTTWNRSPLSGSGEATQPKTGQQRTHLHLNMSATAYQLLERKRAETNQNFANTLEHRHVHRETVHESPPTQQKTTKDTHASIAQNSTPRVGAERSVSPGQRNDPAFHQNRLSPSGAAAGRQKDSLPKRDHRNNTPTQTRHAAGEQQQEGIVRQKPSGLTDADKLAAGLSLAPQQKTRSKTENNRQPTEEPSAAVPSRNPETRTLTVDYFTNGNSDSFEDGEGEEEGEAPTNNAAKQTGTRKTRAPLSQQASARKTSTASPSRAKTTKSPTKRCAKPSGTPPYRRPCGRAPKNCEWDKQVGVWKPKSTSGKKSSAKRKPKNGPPGGAPSNSNTESIEAARRRSPRRGNRNGELGDENDTADAKAPPNFSVSSATPAKLIPQPSGKPPANSTWDGNTGVWKKNVEKTTRKPQAKAAAKKRKGPVPQPVGRPPAGCTWDGKTGKWKKKKIPRAKAASKETKDPILEPQGETSLNCEWDNEAGNSRVLGARIEDTKDISHELHQELSTEAVPTDDNHTQCDKEATIVTLADESPAPNKTKKRKTPSAAAQGLFWDVKAGLWLTSVAAETDPASTGDTPLDPPPVHSEQEGKNRPWYKKFRGIS